MELKSKQEAIAGIAEAFKQRHYRSAQGWGTYLNFDSEPRYKRLLALPKNATEEQVVAIAGTNIWTENVCDECEQDVGVTVMLGEEPDYESRTAWICPECLEKAVEFAKAV